MALANLGVCYFPEHWPREQWADQAQTMASLGLRLVRMGEFAWSRIEPRREQFDWAWLDEAIETVAGAGLDIILCTPTACPPKWLVDEYPEILPVDDTGRTRGFGSRRHYRFASERYRAEARRISTKVVGRYGEHPAIVGWQLDNEYGCHETTLSYAPEDLREFQHWLQRRYGDVESLNRAWGNVFWSQEYSSFDAVELPVGAVTEANPAHRMDYWRFASDQVVSFNREQVKSLRDTVVARPWVTHNFMGNFVEFDHFAVGADIDIASWDSYPLGFLDQAWFTEEEKQRYRRLGHPDWAAFHHDLYRGVGNGRMAVMEQQPGPVNWATSNAMPPAGAVALWSMEAIAHGAEFVSYFRFRQNPRAQEQMHAALQLPDGSPAPAYVEVERLARELASLPDAEPQQAAVALIFDYPSCWATSIQPHAQGMHALEASFEYYRALRELGVDVDIIGPDASLTGYQLLVLPTFQFAGDSLVERIAKAGCACVIGPRCGSRTIDFGLPDELPPGPLQRLLPLRVIAVDSMRPGSARSVTLDQNTYAIERWYEAIDSQLEPLATGADDTAFWYRKDNYHYLNGWTSHNVLKRVFDKVITECGLNTHTLAPDLRLRSRGDLLFGFNFADTPQPLIIENARRLLGDAHLSPGSYAVWQREPGTAG